MLKNHIERLSKEFDFESSLSSDPMGVYRFPLEEGIEILIKEMEPGYSFHCKICPCPTTKEEGFFTHMMLGNLFGQGTKGAVLGLDSEGKMITLTLDVNDQGDYREFRDSMEDFFNSVEFWKEESLNYQEGKE